MKQSRYRWGGLVLVGVAAVASMAVLGGTRAEESAPPPPAGRPAMAPMKFKNLKVLKKLPPDQLIPVMHKINASLGVRCDFCHVINADHTGFERDDKPTKGMARQMIVMMQGLNAKQKILDGKATCFMCHHGRAEPENQASAPEPPPGAPAR